MNALIDWALALDPASAFLFALPFIVAAAGLLAHAVRAMRARARASEPQPSRYAREPRRDRPAWG